MCQNSKDNLEYKVIFFKTNTNNVDKSTFEFANRETDSYRSFNAYLLLLWNKHKIFIIIKHLRKR